MLLSDRTRSWVGKLSERTWDDTVNVGVSGLSLSVAQLFSIVEQLHSSSCVAMNTVRVQDAVRLAKPTHLDCPTRVQPGHESPRNLTNERTG
jgi:hypothetical protein